MNRCTGTAVYVGIEWMCDLDPGHEGEHAVIPVQVVPA